MLVGLLIGFPGVPFGKKACHHQEMRPGWVVVAAMIVAVVVAWCRWASAQLGSSTTSYQTTVFRCLVHSVGLISVLETGVPGPW